MTVLVAGATGTLGRWLVAELQARGERVRALVRNGTRAAALITTPAELALGDLADTGAKLEEVCQGVDVVISAAGRSCTTRRISDRGRFMSVDYDGNRRLLDAALRAGVERFLYVSVLNAQRLRHLEYIDAHERFVDLLRASAIESTVVRANGFFAGYLELLELVRSPGPATLIGDGTAKDNPIHEADLAVACVEALERGEREIDVGGPQILTRREQLELACTIARRDPRILELPPRLVRAGAALLSPLDPRRAQVIKFLTAICTIDMVGPPSGQQRLADYLETAASVSD